MAARNKKIKKDAGTIWPAFQADKAGEGIDFSKLAEAGDQIYENIPEEEKAIMDSMIFLALNGITPKDYETYYNIFQFTKKLVDNSSEKAGDDEDEDEYPDSFFGNGFGRRLYDVKQYEPYEDAANRTLVLKIQMKDVTKPPMWREVEVPADYNFLQLHEVIQTVTYLENCHLWQFSKKAYDHGLLIGIEREDDYPFSTGVDEITHPADATPLTQFLHQKGDKLEYTYDFGDDWIFVVEVKGVLEKKSSHPVCIKYKSDFNPIEDIGGIWSYCQARSDLDNWSKMSKKDKKERADYYAFDSPEEYIEFLDEHKIDLEYVNESLRDLN